MRKKAAVGGLLASLLLSLSTLLAPAFAQNTPTPTTTPDLTPGVPHEMQEGAVAPANPKPGPDYSPPTSVEQVNRRYQEWLATHPRPQTQQELPQGTAPAPAPLPLPTD